MFDFNKNINEELSEKRYKELKKFFTIRGKYDSLKKLERLYAELQLKNAIDIVDSNNTESTPVNDIPQEDEPSTELEVEVKPERKPNFPKGKIGKLAHTINTDNLAFKLALLNIAEIHSMILDLYDYTLYEDNWNESTEKEFEDLLSDYNKNLDQIESMLPSMEWHSPSIKLEFMRTYRDLIKADANSWNRVYARHSNYLRYRTNRKTIISQICDVLGGIKANKDTNYPGIFKYFNDRCAGIKLYDNSNKKEKTNVLSEWLKPHLNEVMDDLKDSAAFASGAIDGRDIYKVFHVYVKCRKLAYAIFNLMTSNSEFNGYAKWHNRFIDYCDATLNDRQLELLINAVDSENQFETVDDYQNTMDEESWESKGIFESWFDDELEYYKNNKDRFNKSKIHKINMVPDNANVCKITCDGTYVYASTNFYPGDIIEICPTKMLGHDSLYSRDVRDVVFEIPGKKYVIPFGYCRFYLHDVPFDQCNCTYIWDPVKRVIVIKAINKIQKNSRLFLQTEMQ